MRDPRGTQAPPCVVGDRGWLIAALALVTVALSGCSSLGPDRTAAGESAVAFYESLDTGDEAAACDLLAEGTRDELERSADSSCDSAIGDEDLPAAGAVVEAVAYGRNARVILDGDVVFLTVEDGLWKVMAADCELRANAPYECTLKEG